MTMPRVIKLEFISKLKIKRNAWLPSASNQSLHFIFEFETVLKFYNLGARESHNHTLQTKVWHREEESKNNNSHINCLTSMMRPFGPQNLYLNNRGRVSLGDATYQLSEL